MLELGEFVFDVQTHPEKRRRETNMMLIEALVIAILLYSVLADQIKKKAVAFYTGTYALTAFVIAYYLLGWSHKVPDVINNWGMDLFQRGALSTATFIIVMFLGTITKHNDFSIRLLKIRGEISIIGCILAFAHNIIFGVVYFPMMIWNRQALDGPRMLAARLTVILLVLMIPLFLTSFQCIRRKMKPKSWKRLQRLAYPFYYLIYIHVMVLFSVNAKDHIFDIVVYTAIYVLYTVLRLRKYFLTKKKKENRRLKAEEARQTAK